MVRPVEIEGGESVIERILGRPEENFTLPIPFGQRQIDLVDSIDKRIRFLRRRFPNGRNGAVGIVDDDSPDNAVQQQLKRHPRAPCEWLDIAFAGSARFPDEQFDQLADLELPARIAEW